MLVGVRRLFHRLCLCLFVVVPLFRCVNVGVFVVLSLCLFVDTYPAMFGLISFNYQSDCFKAATRLVLFLFVRKHSSVAVIKIFIWCVRVTCTILLSSIFL